LLMLLVDFFQGIQRTGFLWGDCAPRNMVLNQDSRLIRIMDFERTLSLYECPVPAKLFSRYVGSYSREEFSSFLFREEQDILFAQFLIEEDNISIDIRSISSNRKKKLLNAMFGTRGNYDLTEVRQAEDLMSSVATPFFVDGNAFYPMDCIDRISSKLGQGAYIKLVLRLIELNNIDRHDELKRTQKIIK